MVIAHETVLGPNLNVSVVPVSVNEHRADRRLIGIADGETLESIVVHQLIAGFSRVCRLGIGIDDAGGEQGVLHVMPTLLLRAFFRERRRAREFWIETRINFAKRVNDRLLPITMNGPSPR